MDAISTSSLITNEVPEQSLPLGRTLLDQANGFSGVIRALKGEALIVDRLRELGFVPGHRVTLKGRAPFGDPLIVDVNGTTVAIRRAEALCIQL